MSRLIEADVVDELFSPFSSAFTDPEVMSAYLQTLQLISNATGIDAVVHGEWIVSYTGGIKQTECSECGTSFTTYDVYGWNYCPWCGAKMDGERKEGEL